MVDTPLLSALLKTHIEHTGTSARALAEKLDASYPSVLAWMSKGGIPRKPEHREALRRELALAPDVFARVLAASSKDPIDIPDEGPLDLRQLVLRHLGNRNLTERTFADLAKIPYATLMGVTRRGAVPRGGTLEQLSQALGLPLDVVRDAAMRTRGEAEAAGHAVEITDEPETHVHSAGELPSTAPNVPQTALETVQPDSGELARIANERVAASGLSAAAYARTHDLPYLALSRLLATGIEPDSPELLAQLRAAFPPALVTAAPVAPPPHRATDDGTRALHRSDDAAPQAGHSLHAALLELVRSRGWSQMRFAKESGLAVPTAAKLLKGELPGRGPTHQKLRDLLGLDQAAYAALLPPVPESAEGPATRRAQPKTEAVCDADTLKLCRAINDLDVSQRAAVWKLVQTFRGQ
jgi:transcriptional regulator with XRE-family HTH domain